MSIRLVNQGTINKNYVTLGDVSIYFSYETPVAIEIPAFLAEELQLAYRGLVISQNVWSVTTGKYLNEISSDKKRRINNDDFQEIINKLDARFKRVLQ